MGLAGGRKLAFGKTGTPMLLQNLRNKLEWLTYTRIKAENNFVKFCAFDVSFVVKTSREALTKHRNIVIISYHKHKQ